MTPGRTGRPRASGSSPTGQGTRADVLAAAADLFCTRGYASASTHAIAEAAGIRQASLYHHFARKADVLLALLLDTVQPSLDVAAQLLARDEEPAARLWALCVSDVRLLASGPHNVGALYLLPEVSDEQFAPFRERRSELETAYRTLVAACGIDAAQSWGGAQLVLALVENVILQRKRGIAPTDAKAAEIASAALRVLDLDRAVRQRAADTGARILSALD
ncbi:TetR/AcrR family transcriptional regulator [Microbacterium sp. SORGH_AS_0888]|uniref:TetR/AcrR family transcriptional regulator n=1 Tax=Microbacterium sp. SORGH_AS_0888 TaxID=3041791 RepID=UPI00277D5343|nr:TetR/AcrR family transcriptional regulator [Microbacterium sp. SORGH_AS_0888]MDQ1129281.1 AcrR family transcriptional regulator [Microbacterium sp. SORGH_AS_0888]